MSLRMSKKEIILLLSALFLIVSVFAGGYYLYLKPKKQEISSKQLQLTTEEQLLATIQARLAGVKTPSAETVAELQKKVPVKQQLEQLIIELNKAEVLSNSLISSMNFSEADLIISPEESPTEGEQATEEIPPDEADNTEDTGEPEEPVELEQQVQPIPLPEGIKKLNINLEVTSPSFYDLMQFLETVESLSRLVVIESVAFSGNNEQTKIEQEKQDLTYTVTLAAFYMPELEDLQDQLPELEVPEPSNKTNPFASSPDITNDAPS